MSATKLAAALDARLHFDVFPVAPNSKVPLLKENWLQIATRDEATIRQWWTEHPDANIGGVTGDKLVVDIDPKNNGMETFIILKDVAEFSKTRVSNTQSGGNHLVYALPPHTIVKGGTHKLGQGVDVKSYGGYILLPGSTIGDKSYTWANQNEIALAPQWIIDSCKAHKPKTDTAGKRIVEEDDQAREMFEQWIRDRAPRPIMGEIDDTTYKVAARGYDFGCSQDTVHEILLGWNETHADGLGDIERLAEVVESAGKNRENAIGSRHPNAPGFDAIEIDESKAPSSTPASSKPKSTDGLKLERYFAAAAKALSTQAEPLIKGILDRNAMSILYGESNTGKTFIAVDLAFHIAAELAWAKCKVRAGAVVYVAAEGGAGVYKRLAALREHYPDVGDIPLFVIKFPIDLLHGKEHAQALVRLCQEAASEAGMPLELVVIDTLSRAMSGGDENSSTDMGAMVKSFDAIREATGAHLMVIHHSGKDRARGARGHSLLRAATDTEIEIERGKLTVTKQRDMEGDFHQPFELTNVTIGLDSDGAVVTSCVVRLLTKQEAAEVEVELTPTERRYLNRLEKHLGATPEKVFGWQIEAEIVGKPHSDIANQRSTLSELLKALSDKGKLRFVKRNQYVLA